MQTAPKKVINAWAMYDWGNSAYNLVITSTIFPAYFEAVAVDNKEISKTAVTFLGRQFENTALYNYCLLYTSIYKYLRRYISCVAFFIRLTS